MNMWHIVGEQSRRSGFIAEALNKRESWQSDGAGPAVRRRQMAHWHRGLSLETPRGLAAGEGVSGGCSKLHCPSRWHWCCSTALPVSWNRTAVTCSTTFTHRLDRSSDIHTGRHLFKCPWRSSQLDTSVCFESAPWCDEAQGCKPLS
ncbi:hypothetical protein MRX96_021338 [Rhipicephalus microplus]